MTSFLRAIPLIVYRAGTGGMPIVVGLMIAHHWGLAEMAAYTVANAAIAIAMVVADWGAMRALPRNLVTLEPAAAAEMLGAANAVRLIIIALLIVAGLGATAAGWIDADAAVYLALLFPIVPLSVIATNALSERVVHGETREVGLAVVAGLLVFGALVLAFDLGPYTFVAAFVTGRVVETMVIAWKRFWTLSVHFRSIRETAAALWPFSAQLIMGIVYARLAVFTVERMTTREELGVFSVAVALQSALYLIPSSTAMIHYPELTRRAHTGEGGTRKILVRYAIVSLAAVLFGLAVVLLLANPIMSALKVPPQYRTFLVAYAAIALPGVFTTMVGFLMQARGLEMTAARLSVLTLTLALVYQIAALRAAGLWGIVIAVAAAEVTTQIVFGLVLRRSVARMPPLGYKAGR